MEKQITFDGIEIENDCRQRSDLFVRLNPKSRQEIEDAINPMYRTGRRPETESTLNEFGVRQ